MKTILIIVSKNVFNFEISEIINEIKSLKFNETLHNIKFIYLNEALSKSLFFHCV